MEEGSSTTAVAWGLAGDLSVTGNLVLTGDRGGFYDDRASRLGKMGACSSSDAKEKQVNIPAPSYRAVGDLNVISEAGDVAGTRERDSPSLLKGQNALVSLCCTASQAICP